MADLTPGTLNFLLHESWQKEADKIAAADERLNTDGGSGALARDAIAKLDESEASYASNTVEALLEGRSEADLLAIVTLVRRALRKVDSTVKTYVDAHKVEAVELPAEEVVSIRSDRKAAVEAANALRLAAKASDPAFGASPDLDLHFPEFTNLRGAGPGTRTPSPRLRGSFAWAVDGKPVTGEKIADVARKIGVTGPEIKQALADYWHANYKNAAGEPVDFPWADAPDSFEFTYTSGDVNDPDGHQVYRVTAEQRSSDEDETEDETFEEASDTDGDEDIFES